MPQLPIVTASVGATEPSTGPSPGVEVSLPRADIIAWGLATTAVIAALAWSYAPNIHQMVQTWIHDRDYSHGWLVLPVALLVLWRRPRPSSNLASWRPSLWGWVILAGSLLARSAFSELGYTWIEGSTLLPAVVGLALAAGGPRFLAWTWPAIAFLVFMYPMPAQVVGVISQPLQSWATIGACSLLRATGLWVMHEGNIIIVGSEQLEVAAACNGLSMLVSLAATVVALMMLTPMTMTRRVVLSLSIIPVGLACNVIRIAATAWCYDVYGAKVGGPWAHDIAGWLMMPLAIGMVAAELWIISWLITEDPDASPPIRQVAARKPRP